MEFVEVREAAARIGVTTRQVQHLASSGDLRLVARGLVDRNSLDRHLATRQGSRRRAWSQNTAWAAVALLSGQAADWIGESQRSRLRGRLRHLTAAELVSRARERADVHRYQGHTKAADRLRRDLIDTGGSTVALGLAGTYGVDGYVAAADLDRIIARHALVEAEDGQYTLRATGMPLDVVRGLVSNGQVLGALDLAESQDIRESRAGLDALDEALRRLRG